MYYGTFSDVKNCSCITVYVCVIELKFAVFHVHALLMYLPVTIYFSKDCFVTVSIDSIVGFNVPIDTL